MRIYYRRTADTLRYEGLHILLWRALKLCSRPLGHLELETFYQKDLTEPLKEIRAKADLTVTQATESDIDELTALELSGTRPRPFQDQSIRASIIQRFGRGSKCFVGKIGTEIVHYNWITFHRKKWLAESYFIHLRDDEAFCHSGYTSEAWRGRNIHAAVNNQMLHFLQRAGYRKAYTNANTDNKSSQKALPRVGWQISGIVFYFIPRGAEKAWIWRINGTLPPVL